MIRRQIWCIAVSSLVAVLPASARDVTRGSVLEEDGTLPPVEAEYDEDWLFEDEFGPDPAERDPWEPGNRAVFGFNEGIYQYVLDPVAEAYEAVVPAVVRTSVRHFFTNIREPVIFANEVLQGAGGDAATTFGRFAVNTTVGIGGLFDPATPIGLEHHNTDFGETLAFYGTPAGPYVVLPLLGPATARDAVGEGVDLLLRPDTWLLAAAPVFVVNAGDGLSAYEMERRRLDALRDTSVDFYSAMRGAYLMDRDAGIDARLAELGCERAE